ncbi:MAG TPA: TIGR03118 family protein [Candidatus Acidoferrum sp.]|nr:TIGR03118 family protein [Candidatus Acidoferrum sp.]
MWSCKFLKFLAVSVLSLFLLPVPASAQHYKQTNLVSDIPGMAPVTDPNLINPWGLSRSNTSPWWISDNNSGFSSLYTGAGVGVPINGTGTVIIPPPKNSPSGTTATPTGTVFNGSPDFVLPNGRPARFIFATEDGTISGWNGGPSAVLMVDNSANGSPNGAVYKGATTADINGKRFLYVTNFRKARVEVYDTNFTRVPLGDNAFQADQGEDIPDGFAPFNIQNIGGTLFVTYAKQNAARHDDVAGDGFGFVLFFTPSGRLIGHLQHGPWMNSPWGVVWTPRDFGEYSNSILVGNFGSGKIAAFNGFTGKFIDFLKNPDDSVMVIDGLWMIAFGGDSDPAPPKNGSGPATTLFFTAGIQGESHGLFGTITPVDGLDGDEE